ncbi:MAG: hypothetical protein KAI73_04260, partial [Rhodospirillaceae bacterium]|nr:hypothetical protein [Rhodospirillaceae bacterium]
MAKRKKSSGGKSGTKSGGGREQNRALFLNRLAKILGVPARDAEALASIDLKSSIRINRLSPMGADKILSALNELELELEPIPWCADAFFLIDGKGVAVESDLFTGGHIYIQNASSLIPSLVLQPKANERLLDACAAPGGKTCHILERFPTIEITAVELNKSRLAQVRENLDRLGFAPRAGLKLLAGDAADPSSWWDG